MINLFFVKGNSWSWRQIISYNGRKAYRRETIHENDLFHRTVTVHGYGLIAIGVLPYYWHAEISLKRNEMEWEKVFPLAIWAVVLGGFWVQPIYADAASGSWRTRLLLPEA